MHIILVYLGYSFWTLSWILIAVKSMRDRASGFPPFLLTPILAYDIVFVALSLRFGFSPLFPAEGLVWILADLVNLWVLMKYGPRENAVPLRKYFVAQFTVILAPTSALVLALSPATPTGFVDIGTCFIPFIAFSFFLDLHKRPSLAGRSLLAMLLRVLAQYNAIFQSYVLKHSSLPHKVLIGFAIVTVAFDVTYFILHFKLMRGSRGLVWNAL